MRYIQVAFLTIAIAIAVGCSGSGSTDPLIPIDPQKSESTAVTDSNRFLLGFWEIRVSEDHSSVDSVPLRLADNHYNVTRLLEQTCDDCLTIDEIIFTPPDKLRIGITLMNPLPYLHPAFDVRGIIMTEHGYHFPEADRLISWGQDVPHVLFADGYTTLFNPSDFPVDPDIPPVFRYYPGDFSIGDTPGSTLNPYMAWFRDEERASFPGGYGSTRYLDMNIPDGAFSFGYAIDACWSPPVGDPTDLNSYLPGANSREAYRIDVEIGRSLTSDPGSSGTIYVDVFDHQDLYTIQSVTAECPDLFDGVVDLDYLKMIDDEGFRYTGTLSNELGAGLGDHPLLIRVVDTEQDGNVGQIDAWHVVNVPFKNGWSIAWGKAQVADLVLDADGSLYVVGSHGSITDFDSDITNEIRYSSGLSDAYVTKYFPDGSLDWVRTWGGSQDDKATGVSIDMDGNVYVSGNFENTCDFDPGPGVDEHTAVNSDDCFVVKFNSSGEFQWAATWGGESVDACTAIAVTPGGDAVIAGTFYDKADFYPGPGLVEQTSEGYNDIFLLRLDPEGNYKWVKIWGGIYSDKPWDVTIDDFNKIYVCGNFSRGKNSGGVDFDPGTGVDIQLPINGHQSFLSCFGISGHYEWGVRWGGPDNEQVFGVEIDNSGNILVTGNFEEEIDLDPGPGVDNHFAPFGYYLTKFDSSGEHVWSNSFEGGVQVGYTGFPRPMRVTSNSIGDIYVGGAFDDWMDMDPGPTQDIRHAVAWRDNFISKYTQSGEFQWGITWGGPGQDYCWGIESDGQGNVYAAGNISKPVDMDPGPGFVEIPFEDGFLKYGYISMFPPDGVW